MDLISHLEYPECPFCCTSDGIESPCGHMCGIHKDEQGKPRYQCQQGGCQVWEIIHDLDVTGASDADAAATLEDMMADKCMEALARKDISTCD